MRNIILAVIIAVGAGAILYLLATVLGFPAEVAKGVAGLPAFAIQKVYEFLEASSAKHALETTGLAPTMSVKGFSIHPLSAFLFSLIAWTGVILFTGMLMGMAVGAAVEVAAGATQSMGDFKLDDKLFGPLIIFTSFPLRVIAAIYIGCWIGTRSRSYVLAIVACSIALGSGLGFLFSLVTLSSDQIKATFGELGTLERFTTPLPDIAIYIIFAALGFWYGQRQKPIYYLGFIMKILRPETRQTIVEMVQDEAKRARQPAGQAAS
jgi:hypothetical protein